MNDKDLESICKRIKDLEDKIAKRDRDEFVDSVVNETFHKIMKYLYNDCYKDFGSNQILYIQSIIYEGFDKLR